MTYAMHENHHWQQVNINNTNLTYLFFAVNRPSNVSPSNLAQYWNK